MDAIKLILNKIGNIISNIYYNHFWLAITVIVLFVFAIIVFVILSFRRKKDADIIAKSIAKSEINTLTDEEIDNISKNVSDPDTFRKIASSKPSMNEDDENKVTYSDIEEVALTLDENNKLPTSKSVKKETDNKTEEAKTQPQTKRGYTGKWKIKKENDKYYAELVASNGGHLLNTEYYASLSSVKNGIETIKKNIDNGNFAKSIDKHNHYHFKLFSSANKLICVSEDYSSKAKCESGIQSVKRFAKSAVIIYEDFDSSKD